MNFISVFAICLIVSYVLLILFITAIIENLFVGLALFTSIPAAFLTVLVNLSNKIGKLEKRVAELEAHSTEKSSE